MMRENECFILTNNTVMWGIGYGLLDVMHKKFEALEATTETQAIGLHAAYYG